LRTDAAGNAQKRMISGKYLTIASTRAFATAGTAAHPFDCGYGSRPVRRSLQGLAIEESFQEIAQLRKAVLARATSPDLVSTGKPFPVAFPRKRTGTAGEREPAGRKGPCQDARHTLEGGQIEGHDLEKPAGRLNSAKTSPFVANPYTLGQSCSILLLNVL
jgi:hypothetical protein